MLDTFNAPKEDLGELLTSKQELFCQYFCKNSHLFGNQTLSYAEAYGVDLSSYSKLDGKGEYRYYNPLDEGGEDTDENDDIDEEDEEKPKKKGRRTRFSTYWVWIEKSSYDKAYYSCAANASRLLKNDKIQKRITVLLNEMISNEVVDAELMKIILSPRAKHSDKINAIKEHNALKARIIKKLDLTTNGKDIGGLNEKSDDELGAIVAAAESKPDEEGTDTGRDTSPSGTGEKDTSEKEIVEVHPVPVSGV